VKETTNKNKKEPVFPLSLKYRLKNQRLSKQKKCFKKEPNAPKTR